MKKILTLTICLCVIFTLTGLLPVHGEAEIYGSVLRLHVVANSDSDADQALKLCVRDAVLEQNTSLFQDCGTANDAAAVLFHKLEDIKHCAEKVIYELGYDYKVDVRLCHEEYPTKQYGALCFPSGEYLSLQILIGEAAGQNWWCVLFPPLCLSAATVTQTNEDAFISVGLDPEQYKIITETKDPTYEVRFNILVALEDIF